MVVNWAWTRSYRASDVVMSPHASALSLSLSLSLSLFGHFAIAQQFYPILNLTALGMGKKKKQLSQAEIWDDSALIQSWDDALEEYRVCPCKVHPNEVH